MHKIYKFKVQQIWNKNVTVNFKLAGDYCIVVFIIYGKLFCILIGLKKNIWSGLSAEYYMRLKYRRILVVVENKEEDLEGVIVIRINSELAVSTWSLTVGLI